MEKDITDSAPVSLSDQKHPFHRVFYDPALAIASQRLPPEAKTVIYQELAPKRNLYRDGEVPKVIYGLINGWAYRYKLLADGRQQILEFLLPGDNVGLAGLQGWRLSYSARALTPLSLAIIPCATIEKYIDTQPKASQLIFNLIRQKMLVAEERLTNLGRRTAEERIAGLVLELLYRVQQYEQTQSLSFYCPLRQQHIADALGLTRVHVSRTLRQMRQEGLIDIKEKLVEVLDYGRLQEIAGYESFYLLFSGVEKRQNHSQAG